MDSKKELASYVYRHDGRFSLFGTVTDSKGTVALRAGNDDLEELDLIDIRLLADLCTRDEARSPSSISYITGEDQDIVGHALTLLSQLGFADEDDTGYWATNRGRDIITELALEVIKFDKFKYEQGLQEIENLERKYKE